MAWILQNSAPIVALVQGSDNQLFGTTQGCEQCFITSDRSFERKLAFKNTFNYLLGDSDTRPCH